MAVFAGPSVTAGTPASLFYAGLRLFCQIWHTSFKNCSYFNKVRKPAYFRGFSNLTLTLTLTFRVFCDNYTVSFPTFCETYTLATPVPQS